MKIKKKYNKTTILCGFEKDYKMEQCEKNELEQLTFKKIGLEIGDKFILRHENNENQNRYKDIIFTFDGKNISPLKGINQQKFLISICIGRYEIVKIKIK